MINRIWIIKASGVCCCLRLNQLENYQTALKKTTEWTESAKSIAGSLIINIAIKLHKKDSFLPVSKLLHCLVKAVLCILGEQTRYCLIKWLICGTSALILATPVGKVNSIMGNGISAKIEGFRVCGRNVKQGFMAWDFLKLWLFVSSFGSCYGFFSCNSGKCLAMSLYCQSNTYILLNYY